MARYDDEEEPIPEMEKRIKRKLKKEMEEEEEEIDEEEEKETSEPKKGITIQEILTSFDNRITNLESTIFRLKNI